MQKVMMAAGLFALAACEPLPQSSQYPSATTTAPVVAEPGPKLSPAAARSAFYTAEARVEPVAEQICRERTRGANCDFLISIDTTQGDVANAYQSRDSQGRPQITFTSALINDARNTDELAFVMGHEAAHHILGHLDQQAQTATLGAIAGSLAAQLGGLDESTLSQFGAGIGGRVYSKNYELQADSLGTEIAIKAGYDPVKGIGFFSRLPDPGDQFLGSHPANADRIAAVRARAAQLGY
ncbi:M48 family metalloprotease [Falsirhodobacter sp. alg1]|uniref:M48 family metalloprotease n=1 Tax=Falsirhodobacter sp. alg1 TaxID=1472418 RepID=UPI0005EEDE68|nr:M48 family metalloprotease [Falsirhodobacter sp. alg1]